MSHSSLYVLIWFLKWNQMICDESDSEYVICRTKNVVRYRGVEPRQILDTDYPDTVTVTCIWLLYLCRWWNYCNLIYLYHINIPDPGIPCNLRSLAKKTPTVNLGPWLMVKPLTIIIKQTIDFLEKQNQSHKKLGSVFGFPSVMDLFDDHPVNLWKFHSKHSHRLHDTCKQPPFVKAVIDSLYKGLP